MARGITVRVQGFYGLNLNSKPLDKMGETHDISPKTFNGFKQHIYEINTIYWYRKCLIFFSILKCCMIHHFFIQLWSIIFLNRLHVVPINGSLRDDMWLIEGLYVAYFKKQENQMRYFLNWETKLKQIFIYLH